MSRIKFYTPKFIMRSTDNTALRIIDLWSFKSSKSNKRYIVEVEYFSHDFLGLKFYWKGVEQSKHRYSLLTNDFEPRTIVMSCIQIMLRYFKENNCASFGFVGAPDINPSKDEEKPNRRFRFYRRLMLTLFSPDKFIQVNDPNESLYLLINKEMYDKGYISLQDIEKELAKIYIGEYNLSLSQ